MNKQELIRAQKFGVEIESVGLDTRAASKVLAEHWGVQPNYIGTYYETWGVDDNKGRTWKFMTDGSIAGRGCETVTPPLDYDDIDMLQDVVRTLREAGARSHSSCGIHVHIDGANHDEKSLTKLLQLFVARQDMINKALGNENRARWCAPIRKGLYDAFKKNANSKASAERIWYSPANDERGCDYRGGINHSHYNPTRYHGVNLHAFFTKGTVEFRLFNSTMHAGKIKAYVQFCLAMSAWAIATKDKNYRFTKVENLTPAEYADRFEDLLARRLELKGSEFKTCRHHMMSILKNHAGLAS